MSIIRPFRGLRPAPGLAPKVAAPPYDVLSSAEARVMAADNPMSFLHVNKPEIDLPEDVDLHDDRVYAQAVTNLRRFRDQGVLVQDPQPWLYLYRQTMGEHQQYGLVVCVSAEEYDRDLIKKHELTRQDKEDDRTRHVAETDCNAGPVFLTYRAVPDIDETVSRIVQASPDEDFVAPDGIAHTLWVIRDEATIQTLVRLFAAVPATYVADGHHRSASAARVARMRREANPAHRGDEEYNFFLAVLFPHDQLKILDYNRLVKDLNGLTQEAFLARVGERFEVSPTDVPKPTAVREFGLFLGGRWYRLRARDGSFPSEDPVGSLDVSILQQNLLAPILGIGDPRKDQRIDFVGGIRGLAELERRCQEGWAAAFALYPTVITQLLSVADAGKIMPPKSTWFEPKLRSGLVVHLLY